MTGGAALPPPAGALGFVAGPDGASRADAGDGGVVEAEFVSAPVRAAPAEPLALPPGAEAELARLRVEALRLVRQLTVAWERQGAGRLPASVRHDLLALHEGIGALLDLTA